MSHVDSHTERYPRARYLLTTKARYSVELCVCVSGDGGMVHGAGWETEDSLSIGMSLNGIGQRRVVSSNVNPRTTCVARAHIKPEL